MLTEFVTSVQFGLVLAPTAAIDIIIAAIMQWRPRRANSVPTSADPTI